MDGRGIVKSVDIFDNRVHVRHTGTDFGIVNPMATDPSFGCQIDRLILASDRSCIAAPCLGRGTKVTHLYDFDSSCRPGRAFAEWGGVRSLVDRFYEPDEYCDGVIINTTDEVMQKVAILMMTADAGVAKIFAPNGELAVLNCGLDNVDSSGGDSIVENAINYFTERSVGKKFSPRDLRLVIGEAAQACCFGLDRRSESTRRAIRLVNAYGRDVVNDIKNPPRIGGIGIDVPLVAVRQACKMGVRDIEVEGLCTSCHGLVSEVMSQPDRFGTYFSGLRESSGTAKDRGYESKNAVLVF